MIVNVTEESKRYLTMAEEPFVYKIVGDFQEQEEGEPGEYLDMAAQIVARKYGEYPKKVIFARAEIAKNERICNIHGEGTENLDVWIEGLVQTDSSYIELGAYITDIWDISGVNRAHDDQLVSHMYVRRFKEDRDE